MLPRISTNLQDQVGVLGPERLGYRYRLQADGKPNLLSGQSVDISIADLLSVTRYSHVSLTSVSRDRIEGL